ncbi:hypothetical protein EV11_1783 [Prochlorococcus sp. SS52]|nr:hypothetical protein EV04_1869 [Prochlorococcus marinus str. LG]KGG20491.1 hypothetical protein EV08_1076 [Prochlorococcus marinus str. SS2]KGG24156.1 hypothetical protein EV09_0762 [Prochlorococcus marinus str. SS35]KGG31586.1 hypothetical protein EV10_1680 [Prochlorococcus marinus str. SS51]KGG34653.1 hypothetical protein EV11_1783 [Prochlorococcus sp. SS52]
MAGPNYWLMKSSSWVVASDLSQSRISIQTCKSTKQPC